jgi:hypothetical protein
LASDLQAEVTAVLFDGGYLDGVFESSGNDEYAIDRWAFEAAGLTPLLNAEQLAGLESVVARYKLRFTSGNSNVTAALVAGMAVGYAASGELDDCARMVGEIDGDFATELRCDVLAEIMYLLPSKQFGWWIALVHHSLAGSDDDRWVLWRHVIPLLPRLSDDQVWEILDTWLHEVPAQSRTDALRDLRFYRHLVTRIAGKQEFLRMLDLLEHTY